MRTLLAGGLLLGLLAGPAGADEIAAVQATARVLPGGMGLTADATPLRFADARVGQPGPVPATTAPGFTIVDARGEAGAGWHVTLTGQDLVSAEGHRIPAACLTFDPTGGVLHRVAGSPLDGDSGPRETGIAGNLAQGVRAVTAAPGAGRGTYLYVPSPGAFSLDLPGDAFAGVYTGTVLVNIVSGP